MKERIYTLFKDEIKIVIDSSFNLSIFFIFITYHLAKNNLIYNDFLIPINNIFSYLKINLALYSKKMQLYYELELGKNNLILFEPFNSLLDKYNLKDIEKENDIVDTISQIEFL